MAATTSLLSPRHWPPAVLHIWLPAAIFVIAVLYQLASPAFPNDHFDHLAKAQQVLRGEYPSIDFMDHPGRPLTIFISAAVLYLSGGTLLGEALLTTTAIALAVVLVYVLALRLSRLPLLSLWAAACVLVIEPRLYNYPKLLVPMVATWIAFGYLERPSPRRAMLLGAWSAIGLMFRYDLGLFSGLIGGTSLLLAHGLRSPRVLGRDAMAAVGTALIGALPLVGWLAVSGRLGSTGALGVTTLVDAVRVTFRPFGAGSGDASWTRYNAENWVYYLFLFAPMVATIVLVARRRVLMATDRQATALATLCMAIVVLLIRGNLDSRLPDVAAPSFVLVAWLLAQLWPGGAWRPPVRLLRAGATLAIVLVSGVSVATIAEANPVRRLGSTILRLPRSIVEPLRLLEQDPLTAWERDGTTDVRGLARWMHDCTAPDDRFLVFGYHPEVFFYSSRAFAGGRLHFHSNYFSSDGEQRLTLERLRGQHVPFVVVERSGVRALDETFALVGAYINRHYTVAAETDFGGPRAFLIYEHEGEAAGSTATGLPCLDAPSDAGGATDDTPATRDPS